jgi:putative flippase GtrA
LANVVNPMFLPALLTLLRSAGVGVLATATDLGALAFFVSVLGVSPRAASIPALALGIGVQFVGNKLFAFGDRSRDWLRQGAQFLGVEALGFAANLILYDLAITHTRLPYLLVRVLTTSVVYFCVCLPLWSRIFRPRMEEQS